MGRIMAVDDDGDILEVMRTRLESSGHDVATFTEPLEALDVLQEQAFDVVVTDVRMPSMDGLTFLRKVRSFGWQVPVILLTAYGTIPSAVEAMKEGATQYLTKPFKGRQLLEEIERALSDRPAPPQPNGPGAARCFPGVYGVSPRMRALSPVLESVVASDSTVLVQGESGTGKELVARMIHQSGERKAGRFVIMDCGATPPSLVESELFGHTRGSFTSATDTRKGLFELAHRGTLFFDEISSLPLDLQTRLLRVLQEGQVKRVGENQMRKMDVRVVAATNVDLLEAVEQGRFRMDLYYRLAVLKVTLPPLRERTEDIPLLADFFLRTFSRKMKKDPMQWEEGLRDRLAGHDWPGNVRELKNVVEAGVVFAKNGVLRLDDLRLAGFDGQRDAPRHGRGERTRETLSLPETLERQERHLIVRALERSNWVQKDAAHQLGVSPRVLCYKIKKLKIEPPVYS